jgi:hypothetical protein
VRLGRGGLYYQQTIPTSRPALPAGPMEEIESTSAALIADSSSEALLAEIREKQRRMSLAPLAMIVAIVVLVVALAAGWPTWLFWPTVVVEVAAIVAARYRDRIGKTVVILYDFEPHVEDAYRRFLEWGDAIASSRRTWHISASGGVHDRKYHAGASQLVQRNATSLRTAAPPRVETNVPVLSVSAGRQSLYFLPDRLLVYDANGVGAITYRTLGLSVTSQRFIEDGGAPSDATVIGHTWRYVNRNGGPDRRFNNNPQLPICLYDELHLSTASGLNEVFQVSRSGVCHGFAAAVQALASATG